MSLGGTNLGPPSTCRGTMVTAAAAAAAVCTNWRRVKLAVGFIMISPLRPSRRTRLRTIADIGGPVKSAKHAAGRSGRHSVREARLLRKPGFFRTRTPGCVLSITTERDDGIPCLPLEPSLQSSSRTGTTAAVGRNVLPTLKFGQPARRLGFVVGLLACGEVSFMKAVLIQVSSVASLASLLRRGAPFRRAGYAGCARRSFCAALRDRSPRSRT